MYYPDFNRIERLIFAVRHRMVSGMKMHEIAAELEPDGIKPENVFLAFHAAKILEADIAAWHAEDDVPTGRLPKMSP